LRAPLRSLLAAAGSAVVVLLVMTAAAFSRGMERALGDAGNPDNVILLSSGSEDSIERSELSPQAVGVAMAAIAGLRQRFGVVYCSPEAHHAVLLRLARDDPRAALAMLRGVELAHATLVHDAVFITAGRAPRGAELLVGRLASVRMGLHPDQLAVGSRLWFDGRPWTISGHFAAPGTPLESEIWVPLAELQVALKRNAQVSCVVATLDDAELADIELFCRQRLDLELTVISEPRYYAKLHAFYQPLRAMVWVTVLLIGSAGLLGGLTTMYAAFATRVRELGTLQAIGFTRSAVLLSLWVEALLLVACGAIVACLVALMTLDGLAVRLTMGTVALAVDERVILSGMIAALAVGCIGVIGPGWRCLALPIPQALRAR
jgi:putative ABC transport system permease protein